MKSICFHCEKVLYFGETVLYCKNGDGHFCNKECAENFFEDDYLEYQFGWTEIA